MLRLLHFHPPSLKEREIFRRPRRWTGKQFLCESLFRRLCVFACFFMVAYWYLHDLERIHIHSIHQDMPLRCIAVPLFLSSTIHLSFKLSLTSVSTCLRWAVLHIWRWEHLLFVYNTFQIKIEQTTRAAKHLLRLDMQTEVKPKVSYHHHFTSPCVFPSHVLHILSEISASMDCFPGLWRKWFGWLYHA